MVDPLSSINSELQLLQIYIFATAETQNKSDLEGRPWISKLLRMAFSARLASLSIICSIWWHLLFILNNRELNNRSIAQNNFFFQQIYFAQTYF